MQRLASAGVQLTTMMAGSLIREVAGKNGRQERPARKRRPKPPFP
jgi:hypothetical protein